MFQSRGQSKRDIIGKGFIPISVAAEAKAKGLLEARKISKAERNKAIEKSGMPGFRQVLQDHLTGQSGPVHLREIISQMYGILKDVRAHIQNRAQAEIVPLQEADSRIRESRTLVRALSEKSMVLGEDLDKLGESTLNVALSCTNPQDLKALFAEYIEPIIQKADVTKESEIDKIQLAIKQVRDEWLAASRSGLCCDLDQKRGSSISGIALRCCASELVRRRKKRT